MKIKTRELIGPALDWAVTTIEAPEALRYGLADWREQRKRNVVNGEFAFRWHQSWAQGGPIIERERLEISPDFPGRWQTHWRAEGPDGVRYYAETPLVAAMRCYVASKLGEEVDVPEELL